MRAFACIPVVALLAACSPAAPQRENSAAPDPAANAASAPAEPPRPVAEAVDVAIILRSDGLLVETAGHAAPLTFEKTTPGQAADALAALGPPKRSSNDECPAGSLDFMNWDIGLQLIFQDGKLAGWWADDEARRLATADGLRAGSAISAIGAARIEGSSVGKVFTVDGINGFVDEATGTKVTELWAGVACIFH